MLAFYNVKMNKKPQKGMETFPSRINKIKMQNVN